MQLKMTMTVHGNLTDSNKGKALLNQKSRWKDVNISLRKMHNVADQHHESTLGIIDHQGFQGCVLQKAWNRIPRQRLSYCWLDFYMTKYTKKYSTILKFRLYETATFYYFYPFSSCVCVCVQRLGVDMGFFLNHSPFYFLSECLSFNLKPTRLG